MHRSRALRNRRRPQAGTLPPRIGCQLHCSRFRVLTPVAAAIMVTAEPAKLDQSCASFRGRSSSAITLSPGRADTQVVRQVAGLFGFQSVRQTRLPGNAADLRLRRIKLYPHRQRLSLRCAFQIHRPTLRAPLFGNHSHSISVRSPSVDIDQRPSRVSGPVYGRGQAVESHCRFAPGWKDEFNSRFRAMPLSWSPGRCAYGGTRRQHSALD